MCRVCGKEQEAISGDQARRQFCSSKCRNYFYNRNMKGKQNFCVDCGKQINLSSKRCYKCAIKKRDLNKEKNGRWKGGTSEGYQIKIYRNILKDNGVNINKCASCGILKERTKRMCIHHINGNHADNRIGNLIALCSKCHLSIHLSKEKKPIKCLFCGETFYVIPSKEKTRKFCNKRCSNKFYNEKRKGIKNLIFRDCINCGKEFGVHPSRINKGDGCKFCCQKCHYQYRKKDKEAMKLWNKEMLKKKVLKNVEKSNLSKLKSSGILLKTKKLSNIMEENEETKETPEETTETPETSETSE